MAFALGCASPSSERFEEPPIEEWQNLVSSRTAGRLSTIAYRQLMCRAAFGLGPFADRVRARRAPSNFAAELIQCHYTDSERTDPSKGETIAFLSGALLTQGSKRTRSEVTFLLRLCTFRTTLSKIEAY